MLEVSVGKVLVLTTSNVREGVAKVGVGILLSLEPSVGN